MPKAKRSGLRILEMVALFIIGPMLLLKYQAVLSGMLLVILIGGAVACFSFLIVDSDFDQRRLWSFRRLNGLPFQRFLPIAIAIGLIIWIVAPERLFDLPTSQTKLWYILVILYPLISVYPQEVIFRAFFWHRYRSFLGRRSMMFITNAACFAWAHVLFGNWVAPLLCFFGGLLFVQTYKSSRSLLLVSLEHALWGLFVISIGLADYFLEGGILEFEKWFAP